MKFKLFGAEAWIQKCNSVCLSDPVVSRKMCLSGCKHVQIRRVASLTMQSKGKKIKDSSREFSSLRIIGHASITVFHGASPHSFTSIPLIHHFEAVAELGDVVPESLSHLARDLWGCSGQTCRWHPACLWCSAIREIDPADVGVLSAGTAFLPPDLPSFRFISLSPPFCPPCREKERASWGWWPVTDGEEARLSTLSVSHSEWLTVEQVTSLGRLLLPVICPLYLSCCHTDYNMRCRRQIK